MATATSEGSLGQMATEDGEKAIQEFELGARFWEPKRERIGGEIETVGVDGSR